MRRTVSPGRLTLGENSTSDGKSSMGPSGIEAKSISRLRGILKVSITLVLAMILSGCMHDFTQEVTGGNSKRGQQLIYSYNCGSCHVIPGVVEAKGTVGPPLRGFGNRIYIAG